MDEWASALEAKSDQINAIDLIGGPQTFTIESVSHGSAEQPMNIHLVESPGKAYRPSRTMRRFMAKTWGWPPTTWAGKRLTLYRNPKIRFGKDEVGGIEISHVSDISSSMTFVLPGARGGRPKTYTAEPLVEAPLEVPADVIETATKAHAEGNLEAYKQWLVENNAPQHIIQAVEKIGA